MINQICHICKKTVLFGVNGWGGDRCMCQMIKPISATERIGLDIWNKYIEAMELHLNDYSVVQKPLSEE